jgi:cephalosporin hydroxylase
LVRGLRLLARDPIEFRRKARRLLQRTPREYRARLDMTLREWLLYHHQRVLFSGVSWMGVPTLKNPLDSWIYQEIIHEVKPDVIVEIGSYQGGSTLFLANLLDMLGKGKVVSIDLDRSRFSIEHPRVVRLDGDSGAPNVVAEAREICAGATSMVIHDGDHREDAVLRDLRAYGPIVTPNSYLIVEDSVIDLFRPGDGIGTFDPGPQGAIARFVAESEGAFAVDRERERYVVTYNPAGYLRRVR